MNEFAKKERKKERIRWRISPGRRSLHPFGGFGFLLGQFLLLPFGGFDHRFDLQLGVLLHRQVLFVLFAAVRLHGVQGRLQLTSSRALFFSAKKTKSKSITKLDFGGKKQTNKRERTIQLGTGRPDAAPLGASR